MKKLLRIIIILLCFFISTDVYASTKTYTRTKDNLLVPENVVVTDENINFILDTKAVNAKEKIYDYANILSDSEEKKLYKAMKNYIDESNIDLVFLTETIVPNIAPTDYMKNFYDYNKFKKNGIIFFVLMNIREVHIYMITTGDVTNYYTEERIGDILQYVYSYFDEEDYYNGFETYVKIVEGFYKMELEEGGKIKNW